MAEQCISMRQLPRQISWLKNGFTGGFQEGIIVTRATNVCGLGFFRIASRIGVNCHVGMFGEASDFPTI